MEIDGGNNKATWHGKAPKPEQTEKDLESLELSDYEKK
jgi:hypothetical protein